MFHFCGTLGSWKRSYSLLTKLAEPVEWPGGSTGDTVWYKLAHAFSFIIDASIPPIDCRPAASGSSVEVKRNKSGLLERAGARAITHTHREARGHTILPLSVKEDGRLRMSRIDRRAGNRRETERRRENLEIRARRKNLTSSFFPFFFPFYLDDSVAPRGAWRHVQSQSRLG